MQSGSFSHEFPVGSSLLWTNVLCHVSNTHWTIEEQVNLQYGVANEQDQNPDGDEGQPSHIDETSSAEQICTL